MHIICFSNQKGGVGKTTTAMNLGAAVAEKGRRILFIDLDPQANLTCGMGLEADSSEISVAEVLLSNNISLEEAIHPTSVRGIDILPSSISLAKFDINVVRMKERERILYKTIEPYIFDYDFIFIDCPPSLNLLTVNALTASEGVVIPVQCYYYSLQGLDSLTKTVEDIKGAYNPLLEIVGIVGTAYETGTNIARSVYETLENKYGNLLFETIIRKSVKIAEAPIHKKPLLAYASSSDVAEAYRKLAEEFLGRV